MDRTTSLCSEPFLSYVSASKFTSTTTRKAKLCFPQALHQQHRGVDSNWARSSCACNSHGEESASKDVREHQRCQQPPASMFPFKPLLSTSYVLSICLCMAKNKRWEDVLHFLFIPHIKLWTQISYTLYWLNQNISGIFHQCFRKDYTDSFHNMGHLHGNSTGWRNMVSAPFI